MKLILLVLTEADLKALEPAKLWLRHNKPEALWILHSPHLGVSGPDVTQAIDREIAALDIDMQKASDVKDFLRAQDLLQSQETKRIERDKVLRQGYKNLASDELAKAHDRLFADFNTGDLANVADVTMLSAPHDRDGVLEMLLSIKGVWNKDFPHGEYALAWPEALVHVAKPEDKPMDTIVVNFTPREIREKQLRDSRYGGVRSTAIRHNIVVKEGETNKPFETLIEEILVKEGFAA